MSEENKRQFFVPRGFAHGFLVLSDEAEFAYKCTDFYNGPDESGIIWNDPDIGIDWQLPADDVLLSAKDAVHPMLKDVEDLFEVGARKTGFGFGELRTVYGQLDLFLFETGSYWR